MIKNSEDTLLTENQINKADIQIKNIAYRAASVASYAPEEARAGLFWTTFQNLVEDEKLDMAFPPSNEFLASIYGVGRDD